MTIQANCIACNNKLSGAVLSPIGILCNSCKSQGLFRKRIIITGITRMNRGHVCISGIDPETLQFVRPIFPAGLERNFVVDGGSQLMRHFSIIEMEFVKYNPSFTYHTEDWIINERFTPKYIGQLNDQEIIYLLNQMSICDLNESIQKKNKSLFIVKSKRILNLYHEYSFNKFKVRVTFEDISGNLHFNIPATDLLLLSMIRYFVEFKKKEYSKEIINLFNDNIYNYVRIGLTREFHGQHWKQVTALITIPDLFGGKTFYDYEKKLGMCA